MLDDFRALVDDLVRDAAARLDGAARDRAIGLAVVQYGKDRPRIRVSDLAAEAGSPPRLPLPDGWITGESAAIQLEHPVGEMPPSLVIRPRWGEIATPDGPVIALPADAVPGAVHRLTWCVPHILSDTEDTVPPSDREAVALYAAAILLDQLAAATSGDADATIQADTVKHGQTGPNHAARAATARQRYHDLLGIDPRRQIPASVTVAPPLPSSRGERRLLNRRSWHGR